MFKLILFLLAMAPIPFSNMHQGDVVVTPPGFQGYEIGSPNAEDSGNFGIAVSANSTTIAVSSAEDVGGYTSAGRVYIYTTSDNKTWGLQQTLEPSELLNGGGLGYSGLSLDGESLAVGHTAASGTNVNGAGVVHVYTRSGSTWSIQQTITCPVDVAGVNFGISVALAGDWLVIGASGEKFESAPSVGAIYVYKRSGSSWSYHNKFVDPGTRLLNENFGKRVSMDSTGTYILTSNRNVLSGFTNAGSAFVYFNNGGTWEFQQQIDNPTPAENEFFAESLSISTNYLSLGQEDIVGSGSGGPVSVYLRSGSTWALQQDLTSSNPVSGGKYGRTLSMTDDLLFAGAERETEQGTANAGRAYQYDRSGITWPAGEERVSPNYSSSSYYSQSISYRDGILIVGAPTETGAVYRSGRIYIYTIP